MSVLGSSSRVCALVLACIRGSWGASCNAGATSCDEADYLSVLQTKRKVTPIIPDLDIIFREDFENLTTANGTDANCTSEQPDGGLAQNCHGWQSDLGPGHVRVKEQPNGGHVLYVSGHRACGKNENDKFVPCGVWSTRGEGPDLTLQKHREYVVDFEACTQEGSTTADFLVQLSAEVADTHGGGGRLVLHSLAGRLESAGCQTFEFKYRNTEFELFSGSRLSIGLLDPADLVAANSPAFANLGLKVHILPDTGFQDASQTPVNVSQSDVDAFLKDFPELLEEPFIRAELANNFSHDLHEVVRAILNGTLPMPTEPDFEQSETFQDAIQESYLEDMDMDTCRTKRRAFVCGLFGLAANYVVPALSTKTWKNACIGLANRGRKVDNKVDDIIEEAQAAEKSPSGIKGVIAKVLGLFRKRSILRILRKHLTWWNVLKAIGVYVARIGFGVISVGASIVEIGRAHV